MSVRVRKKCSECGRFTYRKVDLCIHCGPNKCSMCGIEFHGLASVCEQCKPKRDLKRACDWYEKNKDRKRDYDERRRADKRHLYREASKRFRDSHREEKLAETSSRRRRVRNNTPKWADMRKIKGLYLEAAKMNKGGVKYHVDHIVPLNGKLVSGLHVHYNMRIITADENIRKSNHYSLEHNGVK